MSSLFQFKEFSIDQDRCAMKVGTDGVLLGAWTNLNHHPETILDIGTGTGVIALQLAQRSTAITIDAVEIEENAYEQCTENFENSPWADRLFCYHASIQEYASELTSEEEATYQLIISNPPFFSEDYKPKDAARDKARFTDALPFQHLLICVAHLLTKNGVFSTIIPKKEETHFITLAQEVGLFPRRKCNVNGHKNSPVKRVLLDFSFQKKEIINETLIIELDRHRYTKEYIALVADFYLKM